jgi:hypothetical protein
MGDVLVMHSLTVHASGVNTSNSFRLSLDCRASARNGTINEDQLLPPYSPHLGTWETLSASWDNQDLLQLPPGLTIEKASESPVAATARKSIMEGSSV